MVLIWVADTINGGLIYYTTVLAPRARFLYKCYKFKTQKSIKYKLRVSVIMLPSKSMLLTLQYESFREDERHNEREADTQMHL